MSRLAALLAVLAVLIAPAAGRAETGLVARWAMDAATGAQDERGTPDSAGLPELFARLDAGADIVPGGRFGGALDLPAAGAQAILTSTPRLSLPRFTVLLWARRSGAPGPSRWLFAKGGQSCAGPSYGIGTGATEELFVVARSATGPVSVRAAGTGVWDGDWHAVAATYDGSLLRAYVDGIETGSAPFAGPVTHGLFANWLTIGTTPDAAQCGDTTFPGRLDEVRVYDRALTALELAFVQDRAASAPRFADDAGAVPSGPPAADPSVPAPEMVGVAATLTPDAGSRMVLNAGTLGEVERLEWDLDRDGVADVAGRDGQLGLVFRPSAGTSTIAVRAVGPGGASPFLEREITVPPRAPGGGPVIQKVAEQARGAGPVVATGFDVNLDPDLIRQRPECVVTAGTTVHHRGLTISGCLRPIRALADLPTAERGVLEAIAASGVIDAPASTERLTAALRAGAFDLLDGYVARTPVMVNGVRISPEPGAAVVVYPAQEVIASSGAAVDVAGIDLRVRRNLVLNIDPSRGTIPLGTFARAGGIGRLADLPLAGDVTVDLLPGAGVTPGGALLTVRLRLPTWLTVGGIRAEGTAQVRVGADGRPALEGLTIGPIDAGISDAVAVKGLTISYVTRPDGRREWRGEGRICLAGGACLDASPRYGGGIRIVDGELDFAGASILFPPPGIQLYPGIALDRIGFAVKRNPLVIRGSATITAARVYSIEGGLLLAFPSAAEPFTFDRGIVGPGFPDAFYGRVHTRPTFAISANASVKVPLVGAIPIGEAYLLYEYPGYVAFGGGVRQEFFGVLRMTGRIDGEVNAANGRFNLQGQVETCVVGICRGAAGIISSRGAGGCIDLGPISIGGGVVYDPFKVILWPLDGCRWSRFREPDVRGARALQEGVHLVRIAAGDRSRAIRIEGAVEAPRVRVTGPDGLVLESPPATGLATSGPLRIMRSAEQRLTVVGLQDPVPGTYLITGPGGAPLVGEVTEAEDGAAARISARVEGSGTRRTLRYDIAPRPGQRVTFTELDGEGSAKVLGTATAGRGSLAFETRPGFDRRTVEAQFELDGVPAERRIVARFTPPGPGLPAPRGLRVARGAAGLSLSWDAVRGAERYEVVVTGSTGRQRLLRTTARRLSVRLAGYAAGRVTVRAVARLREGAPAAAAFGRVTARPAAVSALPDGG